MQVEKAVLVKVEAWALSYEQTSAYRLTMYRDSLDGNVTQITKISQITWMTTILEFILFRIYQNFQNYQNVRN